MKKTLLGALAGIILCTLIFVILYATKTITFNNKSENNNVNLNKTQIINNLSNLLSSKEISNNFKDLTKTENDYKITFSCISFSEEENRCEAAAALIDDTIKINVDLVTCGTTKIIKNDKYYIAENGTGCGIDTYSFIIYSKEGNKLYEEENATSYINPSYIEDNIYYYNTYEEYNDNNDKLFYKSISLDTNEITSNTINTKIIDKLPET